MLLHQLLNSQYQILTQMLVETVTFTDVSTPGSSAQLTNGHGPLVTVQQAQFKTQHTHTLLQAQKLLL